MDMLHCLAATSSIIDNSPIARFVKAAFRCDFHRDPKPPFYQLFVFICNILNLRNMLFWQNKDMDRRLRIGVFNRNEKAVLINDTCRTLPCDYFTEYAILCRVHLSRKLLLHSFRSDVPVSILDDVDV